MTSSSELSSAWHGALTEWLPCVVTNLTLEFLRVDHVIRIVPYIELSSPELVRVRRWLLVNLVPIEVFFFWFGAFDLRRFDEDLLPFGKACLARYLECCAAGSFPDGSCFAPLAHVLMPRLVDSWRDEIWLDLESRLTHFSRPASFFDAIGDWPKARAFLQGLAMKGAIAFDTKTGACFSCKPGSCDNIDCMFDSAVFVATEQAWKHRQGSFLVRDEFAIVDILDEAGQTRIAFDV